MVVETIFSTEFRSFKSSRFLDNARKHLFEVRGLNRRAIATSLDARRPPIVRIYTVYPYDFLNPDCRSKNTPLAFVFDGNRNILPRGDAGRELSSFEAKIRQF